MAKGSSCRREESQLPHLLTSGKATASPPPPPPPPRDPAPKRGMLCFSLLLPAPLCKPTCLPKENPQKGQKQAVMVAVRGTGCS